MVVMIEFNGASVNESFSKARHATDARLLSRVYRPLCSNGRLSINAPALLNLVARNPLQATDLASKPPRTARLSTSWAQGNGASSADLSSSSGSSSTGAQAGASNGASSTGSPLVDRLLADPNTEGDLRAVLRQAEAFWKSARTPNGWKAGPEVVRAEPGTSLAAPPEYDVILAGGTLGLMLATALQLRGWRVCIVERNVVKGRTQEWNSSRAELAVLVQQGLLTPEELEQTIVTEFNPVRVGFKDMPEDVWVRDCLNVGVCPRTLMHLLLAKFQAAGGVVLERTELRKACVRDDGVEVRLAPSARGAAAVATAPLGASAAAGADVDAAAAWGSGVEEEANAAAQLPREATCRLLLDCMGHYSSIVKQVRRGRQPEGMLLVVGGCMDGVPPESNRSSDLLYTESDTSPDGMTWFWEAFPAAGGGRTAYMFAYTDAHASRPSFTAVLHTFLERLPRYQGVPLEELSFRRVLMGGFPCYSDGPLRPAFDRVLQVGDAGASHSPLSFGGFGSMLRHLPRLAGGCNDALEYDKLRRGQLALLQPYQPSLAVAWLFQRSMGLGPGQLQPPGGGGSPWQLPADHVNRLLRCNFEVLRMLGDRTMRPFLQDTLKLVPLALSMTGMMLRDPLVIIRVLPQVGVRVLLKWFKHFFCLAAYTLLHLLARHLLAPLLPRSYTLRRWADAWKWGSGLDHAYEPPTSYDTTSSAAGGKQARSGAVGANEGDAMAKQQARADASSATAVAAAKAANGAEEAAAPTFANTSDTEVMPA